jgi:hypothetical protein
MSLNSGIRNVLSNMSIIQNDINDLSNNDVSLQSNIDNKQDKITNNNYLEISDVSGLSQALEYVDTEINKKQDTITTSTDLETNSIFIEGNLNLKNTTTYFDTIVIRRHTGSASINLNELQVWVNDSNILFDNSAILTSYFAVWADKQIDTGYAYDSPVSNIYNNIFEADFGTHSLSGDALII